MVDTHNAFAQLKAKSAIGAVLLAPENQQDTVTSQLNIVMAPMVAEACSTNSSRTSPAISVQETGSRNKRKFSADPHISDEEHRSGCDIFSESQDNSKDLMLDLRLSCALGPSEVVPSDSEEEIAATNELQDAYWSDLSESQLEELVLDNLDKILKSAIRQIVDFGYTEYIAAKAVLRSGIGYGCKDAVTNIVDHALAFLRYGQELDPSREINFEDLHELEKYILAMLVCLLREVGWQWHALDCYSVGEDEFRYMLADILKQNKVNNSGMQFDPVVRTTLAFVTLRSDGEREFMFFRNPSADMLLRESELDINLIKQATIFHYGSISLIEEPCRSTQLATMTIAKKSGSILSYDPNLRLPLWPSADVARQGIMSIWDQADVIKDCHYGHQQMLLRFSLQMACEALGQVALDRRSQDNITIVIAELGYAFVNLKAVPCHCSIS